MATPSSVISMHLPRATTERLKRLAKRFGWTPIDASAGLVEEGPRRSEFAFSDLPDFHIRPLACLKLGGVMRREILAGAKAARPEPPRSGL